MTDDGTTDDRRPRLDGPTLLHLSGFGVLFGIGLLSIAGGLARVDSSWYFGQALVWGAVTVFGSILLLVAFGGSYLSLQRTDS